MTTPTVDALFLGKEPQVRRIYDRLLVEARKLGPFQEDPKKTSIYLANGTAFAGVATPQECAYPHLAHAWTNRRVAGHEK